MSMTLNARIFVPAQASPGEQIELKTLVSHPMESGFRRSNTGTLIARNILTRFTCDYDGEPMFAAEFGPGITANPFLSFYLRATHTAELVFTWTDQNGQQAQESRLLNVQAN